MARVNPTVALINGRIQAVERELEFNQLRLTELQQMLAEAASKVRRRKPPATPEATSASA